MAAVGAFTSMDQAEDLKAFERRLVEYMHGLGPTLWKWRVLLFVAVVLTAITSCSWALGEEESFLQSLMNHKMFTISCTFLILLFFFGAHKRVVVKSIMSDRCRNILEDFNMSCDQIGRLILKPRPKEMDVYQRLYQPGYS